MEAVRATPWALVFALLGDWDDVGRLNTMCQRPEAISSPCTGSSGVQRSRDEVNGKEEHTSWLDGWDVNMC